MYLSVDVSRGLNESPYEKVGKSNIFSGPFAEVVSLNESPYEKVGKLCSFGVIMVEWERLNESPYEKVGKSKDSCLWEVDCRTPQ